MTPLAARSPKITAAQALAHGRTVRRMRRGLLAAAAAAVAVLGFFIVTSSLRPRVQDDAGADRSGRVTMTNPRLSGQDDQNRRFVVTAASASRADVEAVAIDLTAPRYDAPTGDVVSGRSGRYDPLKRELILEGDVAFENPARKTRFTTERAVIDAATNTAVGASPLEGRWPLGFVRGDAYQIEGGGERLLLKGRVRAVIRADDPGEEEQAP